MPNNQFTCGGTLTSGQVYLHVKLYSQTSNSFITFHTSDVIHFSCTVAPLPTPTCPPASVCSKKIMFAFVIFGDEHVI